MSAPTLHPQWLLPQWPVPARVKAVFTTRAGGVSKPPFDSLNLGRPSGDDAAAVDENRAHLRAALGVEPVYLSQTHGVRSVELTQSEPPGAIEADACVSASAGVVCTIRVADCLPVLLAHTRSGVVAAAHAGWRGLAQGVLEANLAHFDALVRRQTGAVARRSDVLAWLGPCIGPTAFEVGAEVRDCFLAHDAGADDCFVARNSGKWLAHLPRLARLRLAAQGVTRIYGNDGSTPWCTFSNPSLFFSHRRDSVALGGSGRMAACIWSN